MSFDEGLIGGDRGSGGADGPAVRRDAGVPDADGAAPPDAVEPPGDRGAADQRRLDAPLPLPDAPPPDAPLPLPDAPPLDAPPPDAPCVPTLQQQVFTVRADGYVDDSLPTTNFGDAALLYIDTVPVQHAYLRFQVYGLLGPVQAVSLNVSVTNGSVDGPAVHATANGWPEQSLTWDTRPAPNGAPLADLGAVAIGALEIPLGAAFSGDGTYSFVLVPTSDDGVDFQSREGGPAPELVVTVSACP